MELCLEQTVILHVGVVALLSSKLVESMAVSDFSHSIRSMLGLHYEAFYQLQTKNGTLLHGWSEGQAAMLSVCHKKELVKCTDLLQSAESIKSICIIEAAAGRI